MAALLSASSTADERAAAATNPATGAPAAIGEMPSPPGFLAEVPGIEAGVAVTAPVRPMPRPGTAESVASLGVATRAALTTPTWSVHDLLALKPRLPEDVKRCDSSVRECAELFDAGYLEDALERSRRTVADHPGSSDAWVVLARALEAVARLSECSLAFTRALELGPDKDDAWMGWAMFKLRSGKLLEARRVLDKALKVLEGHLGGSAQGAVESAVQQRAETLLGQMIRYFLHNARRPEMAQALVDWGVDRLGPRPWLRLLELEARAMGGERKEALKEVERLAKSGPSPALTYGLWGRLSAQDGRLPEAEQYFRESLKGPETATQELQTRLDLYGVLMRRGRSDIAGELLETRIVPAATTPASRRRLATCLGDVGENDLALRQLRLALGASSSDATMWAELAELLTRKHDLRGRRRALLEALARCREKLELARRFGALLDTTEGLGEGEHPTANGVPDEIGATAPREEGLDRREGSVARAPELASRFFEKKLLLPPGPLQGEYVEDCVMPLLAANRERLKDKSVLGIGTGSGILAIYAAASGARKVVATQDGPAAAAIARENARRLGLDSVLESRLVSAGNPPAYAAVRPLETFDVILAVPDSEAERIPLAVSGSVSEKVPSDDNIRHVLSIIEGLREHLNPDGAVILACRFAVLHSLAVSYAFHLGYLVEHHPSLELMDSDWYSLYNTFSAQVASTEQIAPEALLLSTAGPGAHSSSSRPAFVRADWGEDDGEFPRLWDKEVGQILPGVIVIRKRGAALGRTTPKAPALPGREAP